MDLNLTGKRALVCGASQGIGEAIAFELAELGAQVIAMARSSGKLETLISKLPGTGHGMLSCDIADRDTLSEKLDGQLKSGPIEILIHNTGGPPGGPLVDASEEELVKGFENHVLSGRLLVAKLVDGMKEKKYGRIINIVSTSAKAPIPNLGVSNTIRGAIASWAKTLSLELGPFGITVNNILPGYTATPRLYSLIEKTSERLGKSPNEVSEMWINNIPARRFGEPKEIAQAAAFLASPVASYVNGIHLPVDGGRTPSL